MSGIKIVANHRKAEEARADAQGNEEHLEKVEVNGAWGQV